MMIEFVFAWTLKDLIKVGLIIFTAAITLSTIAILLTTLYENEDEDENVSGREALTFIKGSAFISIATEVVCLLLVYVARFFYWIVAIW